MDRLEGFATWLQTPERRGAEPYGNTTIESYVNTASKLLAFLDGAEPTEEAAEQFFQRLDDDGAAPSSLNLYTSAIKVYYKFLGKPANFRPRRHAKARPRLLSHEESAKVLETAVGPLSKKKAPERDTKRALRERAVLMVFKVVGLKLSEGISLRKEDIGDTTIRIVKRGIEDIVPVEDAATIAAIREWMATHHSEWVFPGKDDGRHIDRRTMQAVVHDLLKRAGIKDISRAVEMLRPYTPRDWRRAHRTINDHAANPPTGAFV